MHIQAQTQRLVSYVRESYHELKRVVWPSRRQAIQHSIMVVIASIAVAAFLAALDILFTNGMERILQISF